MSQLASMLDRFISDKRDITTVETRPIDSHEILSKFTEIEENLEVRPSPVVQELLSLKAVPHEEPKKVVTQIQSTWKIEAYDWHEIPVHDLPGFDGSTFFNLSEKIISTSPNGSTTLSQIFRKVKIPAGIQLINSKIIDRKVGISETEISRVIQSLFEAISSLSVKTGKVSNVQMDYRKSDEWNIFEFKIYHMKLDMVSFTRPILLGDDLDLSMAYLFYFIEHQFMGRKGQITTRKSSLTGDEQIDYSTIEFRFL